VQNKKLTCIVKLWFYRVVVTFPRVVQSATIFLANSSFSSKSGLYLPYKSSLHEYWKNLQTKNQQMFSIVVTHLKDPEIKRKNEQMILVLKCLLVTQLGKLRSLCRYYQTRILKNMHLSNKRTYAFPRICQ